MPQQIIFTTPYGVYVHDFVRGSRLVTCECKVRNEDEALAHALWLERRGRDEEAERFLDDWLANHRE